MASDYSVEDAVRRLQDWAVSDAPKLDLALEASAQSVAVRRKGDREPMFTGTWRIHEGKTLLEGEFPPPAAARRLLKLCSIALSLVLGLAVWAFFTQPDTTTKVSLALLAGACVLAFPYVVLALASQWLARQAALLRALERRLKRDAQ